MKQIPTPTGGQMDELRAIIERYKVLSEKRLGLITEYEDQNMSLSEDVRTANNQIKELHKDEAEYLKRIDKLNAERDSHAMAAHRARGEVLAYMDVVDMLASKLQE